MTRKKKRNYSFISNTLEFVGEVIAFPFRILGAIFKAIVEIFD